MKLGDLDALKDSIEKITWYHINKEGQLVKGANSSLNPVYRADDIYNAIDNAPTVNDCPNCEYKKEADYIRSSSSYKELTELRKFKEEYKNSRGNCCNCELKAIQYSLGFQDGFLAAKEQFEKYKEKDE